MSKLPPLPQDWYEDNRQRFNAQTTMQELKLIREAHKHDFYRKNSINIACRSCSAGWFDPNGELWKQIEKLVS